MKANARSALCRSYNPKTIVNGIFSGKERQFNRRFLALASHYLFEPVACTPASGWEKGQVKNQVGNVREWLFAPTPRFDTLADLNAWLEIRCCELVLEQGAVSAPIILNNLHRLLSPAKPEPVSVPTALALTIEPVADCGRYDSLRGGMPCWLN